MPNPTAKKEGIIVAIEDSKKFVEKAMADEALSERLESMTIEEILGLAQEMGLAFTEEELNDALNDVLNNRELSPEELDQCAGGAIVRHNGKYYLLRDGTTVKYANSYTSLALAQRDVLNLNMKAVGISSTMFFTKEAYENAFDVELDLPE